MTGLKCENEYKGSIFKISNALPYNITVARDIVKGYENEEVCVQCSNNGQTIKSKKISVSQSNKCVN